MPKQARSEGRPEAVDRLEVRRQLAELQQALLQQLQQRMAGLPVRAPLPPVLHAFCFMRSAECRRGLLLWAQQAQHARMPCLLGTWRSLSWTKSSASTTKGAVNRAEH
jgi:hypothetical protein